MITQLKPDQIFVFGSNLAGRHGKGAAKQAMKFGAIYGQGIGLQGQTYAIPTKDRYLETLPLPLIQLFVNEFTFFAECNPDLQFLATSIGTGLAGYKSKQIAPLFFRASKLPNVFLPDSFAPTLNDMDKPLEIAISRKGDNVKIQFDGPACSIMSKEDVEKLWDKLGAIKRTPLSPQRLNYADK